MFRSGKIVEPVDRGSAEDVRESRGKKKSVDGTVIEMLEKSGFVVDQEFSSDWLH